jgi:hypothetical protein
VRSCRLPALSLDNIVEFDDTLTSNNELDPHLWVCDPGSLEWASLECFCSLEKLAYTCTLGDLPNLGRKSFFKDELGYDWDTSTNDWCTEQRPYSCLEKFILVSLLFFLGKYIYRSEKIRWSQFFYVWSFELWICLNISKGTPWMHLISHSEWTFLWGSCDPVYCLLVYSRRWKPCKED